MSFTSSGLAAGVSTEGTYTPENLLAGEAPLITDYGVAGGEFAKYTVLGRFTANGRYAPWDPAGEDGEEVAVAIAATEGAGDGEKCAVYVGGFFNHAALTWHSGTTTLAARKAAFGDTGSIKIGSLAG